MNISLSHPFNIPKKPLGKNPFGTSGESSSALFPLKSRTPEKMDDDGIPQLGQKGNPAVLFQPAKIITPRKAGILFLSGFMSAYTGGWLLKKILQKGAPVGEILKGEILKNNVAQPAKATKTQEQIPLELTKQYLALQTNERDTSLFSIIVANPDMIPPVLSYLIAGIGGYLGGSFLQGLQEAWVRREETHIRGNLIYQLKEAFRKSLSLKYQMDDYLKVSARLHISALLKRHGIQNPDGYLRETPILESLETNRMTAYLPYSRQVYVPFGNRRENPLSLFPNPSIDFATMETEDMNPKGWYRPLEIGIFGAGVMAGTLLHGLTSMFKSSFSKSNRFLLNYRKTSREVVQSNFLNEYEAIFMLGYLLRRPMLILSFGILSGLLKVGKLFVDGLREIEVTRVHANTEYRYQTLNWMKLDPAFHTAAETVELKHALSQLEKDLPMLIPYPELLHQRVQTLLANIGRSSAPKYFLMTPGVGLREARS